jgi:hypothetical protein
MHFIRCLIEMVTSPTTGSVGQVGGWDLAQVSKITESPTDNVCSVQLVFLLVYLFVYLFVPAEEAPFLFLLSHVRSSVQR